MNIELIPMTDDMYLEYFKDYENDPDLYMDKSKYERYVYDQEKVLKYIQRQKERMRVPLAIRVNNEIAGEIIIKDMKLGESAVMSIALKNDNYKNRGIGTKAEKLAAQYVFCVMDIPLLLADVLISNTRSIHVLEKAGFTFVREDGDFRYYQMVRR